MARPSPAGYLFQNPGYTVKQHLEKVTLKERPIGLMGVQGCGTRGPAPRGNSGTAFLELKQKVDLKRWAPRPGPTWTEGATKGGRLRPQLKQGAPRAGDTRRQSSSTPPQCRMRRAPAEASTLTSP